MFLIDLVHKFFAWSIMIVHSVSVGLHRFSVNRGEIVSRLSLLSGRELRATLFSSCFSLIAELLIPSLDVFEALLLGLGHLDRCLDKVLGIGAVPGI